MSANEVATMLGRRVARIEAMLKQPASAELRAVAKVATDAAVDGRQAIKVYRQRGEAAAATERDYRKRQMAVQVLLASMRSSGQTETPPVGDPIWSHWTADPPPAGIEVGDLSLAKSFEVVLNGLCADARHDRDVALHAARSAGKALAMFDRIVNLMQSVMKGDKVEERLTSGLAEDLGFDDDDGELAG